MYPPKAPLPTPLQIDASPHGPEALDCIPSHDFTIPLEEIARRRDLRDLSVTSPIWPQLVD